MFVVSIQVLQQANGELITTWARPLAEWEKVSVNYHLRYLNTLKCDWLTDRQTQVVLAIQFRSLLGKRIFQEVYSQFLVLCTKLWCFGCIVVAHVPRHLFHERGLAGSKGAMKGKKQLQTSSDCFQGNNKWWSYCVYFRDLCKQITTWTALHRWNLAQR